MIKTLRYKFIAVTMLSVVLVLIVLMGGINFANYRNVSRNLDLRLDLLEESGGDLASRRNERIPRNEQNGIESEAQTPPEKPSPDSEPPAFDKPPTSRNDNPFAFRNELSVESLFDTRYFTVSVAKDGSISSVNADNIATASEAQAADLALALYEKGRTSGYIKEYKFRAVPTVCEDGTAVTMYIFLNASRELNSFYNFLQISLFVSILGTVLIFLLVFILSKIVIRPVAESYEKQKRFITDASHEIKTPLAIIEANTEVVEMEAGESEWTKSIRHQIARLSSLTEKLVFLSRMDEEGTSLTVTKFNLSDAVSDTAEGFMGVALSSGKRLSLSITPRLSYSGDKAMLTQLISLLLDNALKYAAPESEIRLVLEPYRKGKRTVRLIQENAVEEIEKGNLDVLFERFYRSDPSRNSRTGGHGIGLSVAAAIVRAHGGSIHAKSDDGKSIRFTIHL